MLGVGIIFWLAASTLAVTLEPGPCPNVTVVNLSLVGLSGRWFKYASTENEYDSYQKCMTEYWSFPRNGVSSIDSISISTKTGKLLRVEMDVSINKDNLALEFVSHIPLLGKRTDLIWDTETIYDSYAVSWACREDGPNHIKSVGVYTRERNPSVDVMEKARQISAKNGISVPDLKKYNHEGCN